MTTSTHAGTPTIRTVAGRYFDFMAPHRSAFGIEEIAHALANLCRFTGHTTEFYSVAQHSVIVSSIVPFEDAMHGLLHDAAEAFVGDVASPLKRLLPEYRAIEKRVEAAVLERFGLAPEFPESVKRADLILLLTEQRDLMRNNDEWRQTDVQPLPHRIDPWPPEKARDAFIARYEFLGSRNTRLF